MKSLVQLDINSVDEVIKPAKLRSEYQPNTRPKVMASCYIANMPNELLLEVFSYLPPTQSHEEKRPYDPSPLLFVCQRWRSTYEPVLFQNIHISSEGWRNVFEQAGEVAEAIEALPHLRNYPRTFHLTSLRPFGTVCHHAAEILEFCKGIQKVYLEVDLVVENWSLINAIKNLPQLQELQITGPSIHPLLQQFEFPTLKKLKISRYGSGKESQEHLPPWKRNLLTRDFAHEDTTQTPLFPNRNQLKNLKSLELSDPDASVQVSAEILKLPRHLESLAITWVSHSVAWEDHTLSSIQSLIDIHSSSLKHLHLGMIPGGSISPIMLNFSHFPLLQTLHMSAKNIFTSSPIHALESLSCPSLKSLTIDFYPEDASREFGFDFNVEKKEWMVEFVKMRKEVCKGSKLERIYVIFRPEDDPRDAVRFAGEEDVDGWRKWPWEDIEGARRDVEALGLGVEVEYSEVGWTREGWLRAMEEYEKLGFGENRYGDAEVEELEDLE
jgi:hypothetical protein